MILSHEHRYVYVEVPRTGSTAVKRELRDQYDGHGILAKHATYRDFLRHATEDEKGYFVFSGIRNPLDIAVSRYVNLRENARGHFTDPAEIAKRQSLAGRLERGIHRWVRRTDADFETFFLRWYMLPYDTWTSLDHKQMDMVLRFESLADDFDAVLHKIGISPVRRLPQANVTPGRERDFVSYYTPKAIKRAAWVFGPYLREWGYEFPPEWGDVKVPWWSWPFMRVVRFIRGIYWRYFRFADVVKRRPGGVRAIPRG
jgi:hypothetical protein